jgi:anti-anti-sigma factor
MEITKDGLHYLEIEKAGPTSLVCFCARHFIEQEAIDFVGQQLLSLVEKSGSVNLLLNVAPVEWLGSALIARLIRLRNQLQARGGRVVFCHVHPRLYEQLKVLRLHTYFGIYQDEGQARQALV